MTWFFNPAPREGAAGRLFCLPYAGGSAAVYREWGRALSGEVEVQAVQLPGRGWRLREAPGRDLGELAEKIAEAIEPLADRPFLLFGHSMGAWLGLLVARELERRGLEPIALLASGRQAPQLGCVQPPLSHLEDGDFVAEVQRRYGGIPELIREDHDLLQLLLPALRADIEALERYRHRGEPRLRCPVIALGGQTDRVVPVETLAAWAEETIGPFEIETFPGGHFYFQDNPAPLLRFIEQRFAAALFASADCEFAR